MSKSESTKPVIQNFGQHNLIVYNNIKKLEDNLGFYFSNNYKKGMKLLFLYNNISSQTVKNGLAKYNIDFDNLVKSREMLLIDYNKGYLHDGFFDVDCLIDTLKYEVEKALNEGFKGLSGAGDMSWFFDKNVDVSELFKYEALLNPLVMKFPLTVACIYNFKEVSASLLVNLKKLHSVNIIEEDILNEGKHMSEKFLSDYHTDLLMMDFKELDKVDFLHRMADMISELLKFRSLYIEDHSKNVSELAKAIGKRLKLDESKVESLSIAGEIHDAGMLSQSMELLNKPGPLINFERQLIFDHPKTGYELAKKTCLPESASRAVLEHHEKIDGSGYPEGLNGKRISVEGKILAVAEVVAAMSFYRPYRQDYGERFALKEIESNAGRLYDTEVAKACLEIFDKGFRFTGNGIV
ncbi:MAG: MEDS domain-containing protein [Kosmotogaceae bacterium]